eukprot:3158831-Rhodomonas_salina.2
MQGWSMVEACVSGLQAHQSPPSGGHTFRLRLRRRVGCLQQCRLLRAKAAVRVGAREHGAPQFCTCKSSMFSRCGPLRRLQRCVPSTVCQSLCHRA